VGVVVLKPLSQLPPVPPGRSPTKRRCHTSRLSAASGIVVYLGNRSDLGVPAEVAAREVMSEATISVASSKALLGLFGARDQHLRAIRERLGVSISTRNGQILVEGEEEAVGRATDVLQRLRHEFDRRGGLAPEDVRRALAEVCEGQTFQSAAPLEVFNGRQIRSLSGGQTRYLGMLAKHDLIFCTGPAGTGKTYLAVATALAALREERIRKIVLVRPAVEAGENLGFLPGDLQAKINPYLRPLLDALRDMMDPEMMRRYTESDVIEVIPLAYMRGRTLNEAFMILDEAQNTTVSQMKMFLTRMGTGSKIVVAGDTTQIDLPSRNRSGLVDGLTRLRGIKGFASVELDRRDIVRHRLVRDIVDAYERRSGKAQK